MCRSSTTVSPPTTVLPRRYGEKLLQNSSDSTRPRAPATIRMIPTVLRLNPEVVTSTAKVKMAASTARKEPARLDAVYTRTAYADQDHQFGPVCTHRQAAAISTLHLEPLVVGLRPPGPRGLPTGPLLSGSPAMRPASAT